jgi:pyruvate/2-oxoglutarate dehydrogenase complex dihydrolipoamide acyltransferase (E2) component
VTQQLTIPQLGELTEEVVIVEWLVAPGAMVQAGDPLVEVETDKVETQIESPIAGRVARLLVEQGAEVAVGEAYIEFDT